MECKMNLREIRRYADGECESAGQKELIEAHLVQCDSCRRRLDDLRSLSALIKSAQDVSPAEPPVGILIAEHRKRVRLYPYPARGVLSPLPRFIPIAASLATLVLIAASSFLFRIERANILTGYLMQSFTDMDVIYLSESGHSDAVINVIGR